MIDWRIFVLLVFFLAFWDGAGGDYLRYIDVYEGIENSPRNFEYLFHFFLVVGDNFGFDYFVTQAIFLLIFFVPFIYVIRKELTFFSAGALLYLFIVFGVGSPRQFVASLLIYAFLKYKFFTNNFFSVFFSLFFLYVLHKGVFVLYALCLFYLAARRSSLALFFFIAFFPFVFIIFQDELLYFLSIYVFSGLDSYGFLFRALPFFFAFFFALYLRENKVFHIKRFAMYCFFLLLGCASFFFNVSTLFDRILMAFYPTLIFWSNRLFLGNQIEKRVLDFLFFCYWLFFLLVWYFYSNSAENWRLGKFIWFM